MDMERPQSTDPSMDRSFMNRTAAALSSWGDQSSRAEEKNLRLHSALKQNRTRIPQEWFEKQYEGFAKRDAAARKKTEALLEARRAKCRDFALTRERTLQRLYTEIQPSQQMEREELRKSLDRRITTADARLAAKLKRRDASIAERRQRHEECIAERRSFFADGERSRNERAEEFQSLADARPVAARRAKERLHSTTAEKAQRAQSLRLDAQRQRDAMGQQERQHHQMLMEKHHGLGIWLKDLDRQKR